jgi:hypothetical protein
MTRVTPPRHARTPPRQFVALADRTPPNPTARRVAVWRALNASGTVHIQDLVCVGPGTAAIRRESAPVLGRLDGADGRYRLLPPRMVPPDEQANLVDLLLERSAQHYHKIIKTCEVNFVEEIEFEIFRESFTSDQAQKIRKRFENLVTWCDRAAAAGGRRDDGVPGTRIGLAPPSSAWPLPGLSTARTPV